MARLNAPDWLQTAEHKSDACDATMNPHRNEPERQQSDVWRTGVPFFLDVLARVIPALQDRAKAHER